MSSIVQQEDSKLGAITTASDPGWRREWIESFGPGWYVDATVMGAVVFAFGAVRPLADPDLPMHLAIGEWIVRHGALPLTEPFAWTRQGAPYYAYSWLLQASYYQLLHLFGHLGLRALQGVLVLSSAVAMVVLARAARWRPSHAVILAGLNLIVGSLFIGYLRPQSILLTTIPIIWAGVFLLERDAPVGPAALMLFVASAITANSHLFFPLTIAPIALFWARPPAPPRKWLVGVLSVVLGWVTSPYSTHWLSVFRHNFGPNILLRPPAAITELQPGFVNMLYPVPKPMIGAIVLMLALPWALRTVGLSPRERLLAALYWGAGVVLFGYATRFFVAWWLLTLPFVGSAIVGLTRTSMDAPPRLAIRILGLASCLLIAGSELVKTRALWAMEGDTLRRTLPTAGALPAERLAVALERGGGANGAGRMLSTFSFGSYLTWRLPRLSQSIDSRGIFPDSVSAAEAVVLGSDRDVPLGPWRSADLAIVPLRYRVAAVLDTATGWQRIATTPGEPTALDSVALWVRRDWWARRVRRGADPTTAADPDPSRTGLVTVGRAPR